MPSDNPSRYLIILSGWQQPLPELSPGPNPLDRIPPNRIPETYFLRTEILQKVEKSPSAYPVNRCYLSPTEGTYSLIHQEINQLVLLPVSAWLPTSQPARPIVHPPVCISIRHAACPSLSCPLAHATSRLPAFRLANPFTRLSDIPPPSDLPTHPPGPPDIPLYPLSGLPTQRLAHLTSPTRHQAWQPTHWTIRHPAYPPSCTRLHACQPTLLTCMFEIQLCRNGRKYNWHNQLLVYVNKI